MLQPRLENEQLNSLPSIINTERTRTGFIITDRPDSTQLVDLHVYIIPKRAWKDGQHLAQNEAMDDAISAGFVRVPPNMKIRDLRGSIEQLCGTEDYFPRDFIYLRSVGRCMTIVKAKQENELRVKNYRPPQSFAPEIYILEGRHEDYANLSGASPALSSASYVFGGRRNENGVSVSRPSQDYRHQSTHGGKNYPSSKYVNGSPSRLLSSEIQSWTKYTQVGSDREESPKEFSKLKEEQERLRRRQAELERMRRAAEEKQARSEREEAERRRREQEEEEERRRRREREEEEERRRRREREEEEERRRRREREEEEERRRRQEREEEERRRRQERALAEREEEERRRRQERALAERDDERRRREQEEAAATTIQASYRGFRDRQEFKDRRQKIELEKREAEAKRRKQLEEEEQKRKAKELEEQRRRDLLAKRQREDPESLRARLQELRARRAELEKIREEVIKQLKNIHNRITLRRKEARDMWKKRYFYEKKKTPPIEDRITAMKGDLDQIHRKTVQTMDAEAKHALQIGYPKEAEIGNFILQTTLHHHDIQSIRHQIEQAKLRLTTDVKLRNQAENECRLLRHELNQAKMNLNHIKSRSGV